MLITWEGDSVEATKDAKERFRQLRQFVEDSVKHTFPRGKEENDTGYGNYGASSFFDLKLELMNRRLAVSDLQRSEICGARARLLRFSLEITRACNS